MNKDYSHCNNEECVLKHSCLRYHLHLDALEKKEDRYYFYTSGNKESGCEYFLEKKLHYDKRRIVKRTSA